LSSRHRTKTSQIALRCSTYALNQPGVRWEETKLGLPMSTDAQKSPSELSLEIFAANIAADESLPPTLHKAVEDNKHRKPGELLVAIEKAIGEAFEA
jgi:hypothetical protein